VLPGVCHLGALIDQAAVVATLQSQWSLTLGEPFSAEPGSCSWVAKVTTVDAIPAVLKIGVPHMEGAHEAEGLRFWDGDPTVRLIDVDERFNAMLLERCVPGTSLRGLPEPEQDSVIASLLRRLWRLPSQPHPFRPLSAMLEYWSAEARAAFNPGVDTGLVSEGLRLFEELARTGLVRFYWRRISTPATFSAPIVNRGL
jgi:streptomycin 6-kinase